MNFVDFRADVKVRSERFDNRRAYLDTEEATKMSLVAPFLEMMGYSIFDPTEVRPEYTADVGTKRGEKVDYALLQDGKPIILIECKRYGGALDVNQASQLLRYFGVTEHARIGILTDGITYKFFSDLQAQNRMDESPFFEFNMLDFSDDDVKELYKFTKSEFSSDKIVGAARELREKSEVGAFLERELDAPSGQFVQFVIESVHNGRRTQAVRERYARIIKEAWRQYIEDRLQSRWQSAADLERERDQSPPVEPTLEAEAKAPEFVAAERNALLIIKGIVHDLVDVRGMALRSFTRYCAVLLDDNMHRSICRLYLRETPMRIAFLDEKRHEEQAPLDDLGRSVCPCASAAGHGQTVSAGRGRG